MSRDGVGICHRESHLSEADPADCAWEIVPMIVAFLGSGLVTNALFIAHLGEVMVQYGQACRPKYCTALKKQKAVSAYFTSKQILLFAFAE